MHDAGLDESLGEHSADRLGKALQAIDDGDQDVVEATLSPGDIVIMDNLGSHKAKAVRQAIRAAGAKLIFLLKYSPELNPIEQVFAKLKHLLRKAQARTPDAVGTAIGNLLADFSPAECANYLVNSGYEQA